MTLWLFRFRWFILFCCINTTLIYLAQESDYQLEEIVVTAAKQEESLQKVDQAVTALNKADLRERNIESFEDLNSVAPGLNVSKNEGSRLVMAIRGVGNEANQNAIANPSVSYHLDGIYIASPTIAQAALLDLAQVEVLRGPQGALFGQNASGGVISVLTNRADPSIRDGSLNLTVGNFASTRISGSYNVPISSRVGMRFTALANKHDGYSTNTLLNQDLDDENTYSFRTRLTAEPTTDLRLDAVFHTTSNSRNGPAQKGFFDTTVNARELAQDHLSIWDLNAHLVSLVLEYDLNSYVVKSLSSYQSDRLHIERDNDRHDLASLPLFTILPAIYEPWQVSQDTLTQEFQLVSPQNNQSVKWLAGFFYLKTDVDIFIREYIDFGADGVFDPVSVEEVQAFADGDYGFISDSNPKRTGYSWFTQSDFALTDNTRLIAGARYTQDDVNSLVNNFYGRSGTDELEIASDAVSGRLSIERDLNSTVMSYLSLVKGFKPGGSNLTYGREDVVAPIVVEPTFEHETVLMTEWGFKSTWWNERMALNTALYNYNYKNMQYQATDPEVFQGGVNNIPRSQIQGLEVEIVTQLTSTLRIDLRFSDVNTEITSDHRTLDNVASDNVTNQLLAMGLPLFGDEVQRARANEIKNVRDNQLPKAPKSNASLLINHRSSAFNRGTINTTLTVLHRGQFQYRIFNNSARDLVPAYTIVNLVIDFEPDNLDWTVNFKLLNLSNVDGINSRFTDVFGVGASSEEYIAPRRVQVGWRWEF